MWRLFLLLPVLVGFAFWLATTICLAVFMRKSSAADRSATKDGQWPKVSLIKPVYGLEKDLYENLSTGCRQDYPDYEVIYCVQRKNDPAIEVLEKIRNDFPHSSVKIVIDESDVGPNGKLTNIYNGTRRANGDVLVFSDSDMFLPPDYLKAIVTPLADRQVGISCTLYKAWRPRNLFEALEMLSFNADFVPKMVFAVVTKASIVCPGTTMAMRREVLDEIGGLAPLGHYLVEDYELGRRIVGQGHQIHFAPYVAAMGIDLGTFREWWRHQVYWDQNTRLVNPTGFFFTILLHGVPFAVLYAVTGAPFGWPVLLGTIIARVGTAVGNSFFLQDKDGIKKFWLLPFRDLLGIFVWLASFLKKNIYRRGKTFVLEKGKIVKVR